MKKFRGQRRYYRNLSKIADAFNLNLNKDTWYDLWHFHIDWKGKSNYSKKHHKQHIVILIRLFQKILQQSEKFSKPYQTWLYINIGDGVQDAIYFHTPNPNRDNFPIKFPQIKWLNKVPDLLCGIADLVDYNIGYAKFESGESYIITSKKLGLPL